MQAMKNTIRLLRSTRSSLIAGGIMSGPRAFTQSALLVASMDKQEVTDRVLNLLSSSTFIDPAKVSSVADFKKDLHMDILESVQIIAAAEEEFAIEIPNSEAEKISSTSQLIEYIAAHPQAK